MLVLSSSFSLHGCRFSSTSSSKSRLWLASSAPTREEEGEETKRERNWGVLVLLTVPMAWGTFEPAVRYVYSMDPPLPGFLFSVGYYSVAAVTLLLLSSFVSSPSVTPPPQDNNNNSSPTLWTELTKRRQEEDDDDSVLPVRGGFELGTYLFVGNACQVIGLKTVASDRAAFLLQLTTIFVPLVQGLLNKDMTSISLKTWLACVVALGGVAVMGLDGSSSNDATTTALGGLSLGDVWVVLAALFYTLHCIRLERYAKTTAAIQLAAAKATTETLYTLGTLAVLVWLAHETTQLPSFLSSTQETGLEIVQFVKTTSLSSSSMGGALAAVLWTGLVPVGYTICAQSYGQSRVSPTDANLIYTIQPIFTALIAWIWLGETLGPAGYAGGSLIGLAVLAVANQEEENGVGN